MSVGSFAGDTEGGIGMTARERGETDCTRGVFDVATSTDTAGGAPSQKRHQGLFDEARAILALSVMVFVGVSSFVAMKVTDRYIRITVLPQTTPWLKNRGEEGR